MVPVSLMMATAGNHHGEEVMVVLRVDDGVGRVEAKGDCTEKDNITKQCRVEVPAQVMWAPAGVDVQWS